MRLLDERKSELKLRGDGSSLDALLSAIVGQAHADYVGAVCETADSNSTTRVDLRERTSNTADLKSSRVMIVDDEPINVKVAGKYVRMLGYSNFLTVTDSTKVIEALHEENPDALLLDLMMPEVSGMDILETMRADANLKRIPVIILTASSDRGTRLRALELGAMDFLAKPLDPEELAPRIRNAL